MTNIGPVVLEGKHIRLEPLRQSHAEGLLKAGQASEIWDWLAVRLNTLEAARKFIDAALQAENTGSEYAFAVVMKEGNRIVGSTRYMDVQAAHLGVEVGWTWYSPDVWGTAVNPEAKLLLLGHAFEKWHARRLQLKTDDKNVHSQAAIKKLGAKYEGVLRNHRIRPDGTMRHTVMFSIIDSEWPGIKAGLLKRIK